MLEVHVSVGSSTALSSACPPEVVKVQVGFPFGQSIFHSPAEATAGRANIAVLNAANARRTSFFLMVLPFIRFSAG